MWQHCPISAVRNRVNYLRRQAACSVDLERKRPFGGQNLDSKKIAAVCVI
jgi:hypothetical protein